VRARFAALAIRICAAKVQPFLWHGPVTRGRSFRFIAPAPFAAPYALRPDAQAGPGPRGVDRQAGGDVTRR
jgi:hypothetical protein